MNEILNSKSAINDLFGDFKPDDALVEDLRKKALSKLGNATKLLDHFGGKSVIEIIASKTVSPTFLEGIVVAIDSDDEDRLAFLLRLHKEVVTSALLNDRNHQGVVVMKNVDIPARGKMKSRSQIGAFLGVREKELPLHPAIKRPVIADIEADNPQHVNTKPKTDLLELYGGSVGTTQFAKLIGVSRQAVNERAGYGKLLRFKKGARNYELPVWQAHNGAVLEGLSETLDQLGKNRSSSWSKLIFMVTPNDYLTDNLSTELGIGEVSPVQALRNDCTDDVLRAIEAFDK